MDKEKNNTVKIADAPPSPCRDPQHEPPKMMVFEPGTYRHTCPRCGHETTFTVNGIEMKGGKDD